jgi:hypothetical protein
MMIPTNLDTTSLMPGVAVPLASAEPSPDFAALLAGSQPDAEPAILDDGDAAKVMCAAPPIAARLTHPSLQGPAVVPALVDGGVVGDPPAPIPLSALEDKNDVLETPIIALVQDAVMPMPQSPIEPLAPHPLAMSTKSHDKTASEPPSMTIAAVSNSVAPAVEVVAMKFTRSQIDNAPDVRREADDSAAFGTAIADLQPRRSSQMPVIGAALPPTGSSTLDRRATDFPSQVAHISRDIAAASVGNDLRFNIRSEALGPVSITIERRDEASRPEMSVRLGVETQRAVQAVQQAEPNLTATASPFAHVSVDLNNADQRHRSARGALALKRESRAEPQSETGMAAIERGRFA